MKQENLETVKNYLLTSILPSRDVQELIRLLNENEEPQKAETTPEV